MSNQNGPPGWGDDELSRYLAAFQGNQLATFANKGPLMDDMIAVDAIYQRLFTGAVGKPPIYPMYFLLRAHSAYRAAASTVMGCQLFEANALLRLCLEHAAYGFFIGDDSDKMQRWLTRSDSEANRKAVKREFHNDRLREYITLHAPDMRGPFDYLYSQLIELGAHPNDQGYLRHSRIEERDENIHVIASYLTGDGDRLTESLRLTVQVGIWPLYLFQPMYQARYDQLGLGQELAAITARY